MEKRSPNHPRHGVEILSEVEMQRARTAQEIVDLMNRTQSGEIPGFQIAAEYFEEQGINEPENRISHAIEVAGLGQKGNTKEIATITGDEPLHTDKLVHENGLRIVDEGTTHRFHLNTSDHTAEVSIGSLSNHPQTTGTEYIQGGGGAVINELHNGKISKGDMTVFKLDPHTAHKFSTTSGEGKRRTTMANAGDKPK